MSIPAIIEAVRPGARHVYGLVAAALAALVFWKPGAFAEIAAYVFWSMLHVSPIVIPGMALAAWLVASGASDRISVLFEGRAVRAVMVASLFGALLPVCGITVLPLMTGLLAAGVPLAPVMAFWLASPITGPELISVTAATLGWKFALGKTLAALGLGLLGGCVTGVFFRRSWVRSPLRSNRLVNALTTGCCGGDGGFNFRIWNDAARRTRFWLEFRSIARLMVIVLAPAFAAEYLLNAWLKPDALEPFVGSDSALAVPLAVIIGGPAYIDGYAALPLTRSLMDHGLSPGAAMAFLVSGGVVSIWGAMAIFPVLRLKPFLLFLVLALGGSMIAGWVFDLFY